MKMKTKTSGGFTLLELIIIIAILGIIAGFANAGYSRFIRRSEVTKVARGFESALQVAKHNAWTSGREITVCGIKNINATTPACLTNLNEFNSGNDDDFGWLVFRDSDGDNVVDTGEKVLKKVPFSKRQVRMLWNGNARINIKPNNNTGSWGTLRVYAPFGKNSNLAECTQKNNKPPYDTGKCPLNSTLSEVRVVLSALGNITFLK